MDARGGKRLRTFGQTVAIVTGGAQGFGRAVAERFAASGAETGHPFTAPAAIPRTKRRPETKPASAKYP